MGYRLRTGTTSVVAIDIYPRPVGSLRIEVPATADRLAEIRQHLAAWLKPIGVAHTTAADIVLAVNEASTNCIEHAYRDMDTGSIIVEAALEGRQIVVCIADSGAWRPPRSQPGSRGRGLTLMRTMSRRAEVDASAIGTTIRLRFDLAGVDGLQDGGSRTT